MKKSILLGIALLIMVIPLSFMGQCPTVTPVATGPTTLDCGAISVALLVDVNGGVGTPTSGTGGLSYTWTCPPNATISGPNSPTLATNTPGNYTISVTNPTSMCTVSTTMMVVPGQLTAGFSAYSYSNNPQIVYFNNLSKSSLDPNDIVSVFNCGNGQVLTTLSNTYIPNATYTVPGIYTVTLTAYKGNCVDTFIGKVYPGLPAQAWVGLNEEQFFPEKETKKYFDLMGNEQLVEKNKLLIEQVGIRRRKIIICD